MPGDGAADEEVILDALFALLVRHLFAKAETATARSRSTYVSLSFGYYHETPGSFDDEAP